MHHIAEKDRVRRLVGDRIDLFEPRLALRHQAAGTLERGCVSDEQKVECKPGFFVEFQSRREGLNDSIGPHVARIGGVSRDADQSQQLAGEMWRGLPYGGIEPPKHHPRHMDLHRFCDESTWLVADSLEPAS